MKRIISLSIILVFTTFVLLGNFPAYAISKNVAAKIQVDNATSYVTKAEGFVSSDNFDVKTAQTMLTAAQAQVKKINVYGSAYKSFYTALTTRLSLVKAKIATTIKTLATATIQTKKNIAAAQSAVIALEGLTNVSDDDMVSSTDKIAIIQKAIKTAQIAISKLAIASDDYSDLNTRIQNVSNKLTAAIKGKSSKAEAAVMKAELTLKADTDYSTKSDTFLEYAQKAIAAAQITVAKLDSTSVDYKNLMSRVNTLSARLKTIKDKKLADAKAKLDKTSLTAAETAVKAVENAKLITLSDVQIVLDLETVANLAIAKVSDSATVADYNNRIRTIDQRAKALQTKLNADALAAKTPAKIVSVATVDKKITIKFDKKPLSAVQPNDLKLLQSINGGAKTGLALSSIKVVDDTTIAIAIASIMPLPNVDQSVVNSVQYQGQGEVKAPALVIAKIPYLTIVSATAINLKQIKVVYNKPVDKTSAENLLNYLENGYQISSSVAKAELQADKMTVLITYTATKTPQLALRFTVMNVKNETNVETVASTTFNLTFVDNTPPTIESIIVNGSYSITLNFSEPVNGANNSSNYKIDGYDLTTYGVTGISYDDTIYPSKQTAVTITFNTPMSIGTHSFSVLDTRIYDFNNNYMKAGSTQMTITADSAKPSVVSASSSGLGILDITFNEAVSLPSVYSISVNGVPLDATATVSYKNSSLKTVIEVSKYGLLVNGNNQITMGKSTVYDLYGHTNDTLGISFNVNASINTVAPTINSITTVNNTQLLVYFSTAMSSNALYSYYYSVKDIYGNAISIASITLASSASYAYYINLSTPLTASTYTVTVSGITDVLGNIMSPVAKTVYPTVTSIPSAPTASLIDSVYKRVQVTFSTTMNYSTISNPANYQIALSGSSYGFTSLDSGVTITTASDYKSVIIDFPDYTNITPGVTLLKTLYIKDISGNYTANIVDTISISSNTTVAPTFLRAKAINYTQLQLEYNKPLYYVAANDFYFNGYMAQSATSSNTSVNNFDNVTPISGSIITLTFPTGAINSTVSGTLVAYAPIDTMDSSGIAIVAGTLTSSVINNLLSQATVVNPTIGTNNSGILQIGSDVQATGASSVSSGQTISWSSDNTAYASVSSSGLVHPVAPGTTTIRYTITGSLSNIVVTGSKSVTVYAADTVNNPTYGTIQFGQGTASPSGVPTVSGATIAWTSDNTANATVDATTGVVTPKTASGGSATISYTITISGYTIYHGQVVITVLPQITIQNPTIGNVQIGQPNVTPSNVPSVTGGSIAWLSSDPTKASIDPATGVITPLAVGNTTISYTIKLGTVTLYTGSTPITVWAAVIPATIMNPTLSAGTIQVGGASATVTPGSFIDCGAGQSINWVSSNPAFATVTVSNGTISVNPISSGSNNTSPVSISYMVTDDATHRVVASGSVSITVMGAAPSVAPTSVSPAISVTGTTKTTDLTAPITLAAGQTIKWSSSDLTNTIVSIGTPQSTTTNVTTITAMAPAPAPGTVTISYSVKDASNFEIAKGSIEIIVIQ